ncbi:unnamed protein product [Adineta ricciae]|uniref:Uncharacterized protein n=1 Tax=Adineta ricciae TaxID=249248 RepID=A0A815KNN7_ADIRI|nr:unnamed protein product [Adineta ricciae]CAF1454113.1 unnamed protein product [Adineta ricciae]
MAIAKDSTARTDRDIFKKVKLDIDQLTITNAALQDEYIVTYVVSTAHHDLQNLIEDGIAQSDLARKVMQIICQAKNLFALIIDNIVDLQQPEDLASKYTTYLSNMVRNSTQTHGGIHLRTLLQAMKVITQNRHMRNGLIDQDGLPSLTKSACVDEFDRETIQQLALDLIWTISFNSKAAKF